LRDAVRNRAAPGLLGEDADAARADKQADDDEHDAPEELTPDDRDDAGDHKYDREDPQKSTHVRGGTQGNLSINGAPTRLPQRHPTRPTATAPHAAHRNGTPTRPTARGPSTAPA